jgi:hypothetical protein
MRSYTTKPERVREIFLRFQPPNPITTHLHSSKTITRFPFYSPSFSQLPRLIILFLLKKLMGTKILKIELKIILREKRELPMILVHLLKRRGRRVKVDLKLGGQCKVPSLVANGRLKTPFHLLPLSPQQLSLNLQFFPLPLRFYFTMVLGCYSRISFLFFDL